MILKYYLTVEEARDTIQCVEWRKSKYRGIHIGLVSALGVYLLWDYIKNPDNFYQLVLLILLIGVLFYLSYGVDYTRRQRVRQLVKDKPIYQIELNDENIVCGMNNRKVSIEKARVLYTDKVLVIWLKREWFAIPRRVLGEDGEGMLYSILAQKKIPFLKILLH